MKNLINKDELRSCVSLINKHKIPSPPQTLLDLKNEVLSSTPDMEFIFELISSDIGLSSAILKVTNSSQFNLPEKVFSIQHAVKLLGLSKLKDIIIQPAYKLAMQQNLNGFTNISNHSHYVGLTTSIISEFVITNNDWDKSVFYLAGLFHDVGATVLSLEYPSYMDFYVKHEESPISLTYDEQTSYGATHVAIGVLLAKLWELPLDVCNSIYLHHHEYETFRSIANYETITLSAMLQLAHALNYFHEKGHDENNVDYLLIKRNAIEELLLNDDQLEDINSAISGI